jgi:hypothetical protein
VSALSAARFAGGGPFAGASPPAVQKLALVGTVEAPGQARAFSREVLGSWGLGALSETVGLLTTELVANAVVHVGGSFVVRITPVPGAVRVEVDDGSGDLPELRHPASDEVHGRGILLVESLATRWGVLPRAAGKTVWFEVGTGLG